MSKIIQITTALSNSELYENREGERKVPSNHILYALADDGRIFWRRSDDFDEEWHMETLPALLGGEYEVE